MWIIIALVLIPLRHSNPRKGVITLSFFIFYFLSRFFEDFFRADYPKIYLGLDGMQWLAILTIPLSILGLLILYQDTLFSKLIVKSAKK